MAKKRLLIIEDDSDVAEMLNVYFSSQGYDVLTASNGGDGVSLARAKFPNLILLDLMLPDMDGFDVGKRLRTTTLTRFIPIIFLTQRDSRSDKIAGLEIGADDYVTKPFDIDELRLRVQGSIRRSTRETLHDTRTGLPTGTLVEEMRRRYEGKSGWATLEIQIVGLGAFREMYSFMAADESMAFAAQVITSTIHSQGTISDFAGSINEERFVVLTRTDDVNAMITAMQAEFKEGVKKFYTFIDGERGFVVVQDGEDAQKEVPLMYFIISQVTEGVKA